MLLSAGTAFSQARVQLISKAAWEKHGLMGIIKNAGDSVPENTVWLLDQSTQKPYLQNTYSLRYKGIPLHHVLATAGFHADCVLVAYTKPSGLRFENVTIPPDGKNLLWAFDSTRNHWSLMRKVIKGYHLSLVRVADHEIFQTTDERRFYHSDTSAKAWVFRPDPLTFSNTLYGNPLKDRQDSTYKNLEDQQVAVDLRCQWQNDSFRLQNQWLRFAEVSKPVQPRAVAHTDLKFYRNDPRFEEVNVFYHLSQLQSWWDSLGYSGWNDTVIIDVHGYEGADESAFNPLADPPTIEYGDGGVDDAEDADAAIHEYTHAAFHGLQPNGYSGTQRESVEEGICDFMAAMYSQRCSKNQPGWVYNWDGHNEFWSGRTLINNRIYPGSLTGQSHVDGQLFGGALFDLQSEVGADSAVKMVLATMPFLLPNITMRQAAAMFLQTDSLLHGGAMRWPLIKAFYPRGLLPSLSIDQPVPEKKFICRNSGGFSAGSGPLEVWSFIPGWLRIYDATGQEIQTLRLCPSVPVYIQPEEYAAGIYVLKFENGTDKIIRF